MILSGNISSMSRIFLNVLKMSIVVAIWFINVKMLMSWCVIP